MTEGIIGKKLGMTQVFADDGKVHAVTAIEAGPCTLTQLKTAESDGYNAAQLGFGEKGQTKFSKKKRDKEREKYDSLREFRLDDIGDMEVGQKIE